jgi:hypothetical protein
MPPKNPAPAALAAALGVGLVALALGAAPAAASDLNDAGDFALIASDGFTKTVDGAFFSDPERTDFPNLQPNEGKGGDTRAWAMTLYKRDLWVTDSNSRFQGADAGGQIWRYRPSSPDEAGDWGLGGTWDLMYESPRVAPLLIALGGFPSDAVRDYGYREMITCSAGDKVPRIYAGTFGIPGHILYYQPLLKTFRKTSDEGLFNTLQDLIDRTFDMGYRSLACYRGRLWASPAGQLTDFDTTEHPVVLMNPDPAHGAPWQRTIDVSDPASHPLADTGNIGIFQMEVVGDYLYAAVINRETGMELWRGDGRDCPLPWKSDAPCNMIWTKIIDNGAGRPPDAVAAVVDNGGATLGVFGNDLYLGLAESGIAGFSLPELVRVPNAGTAPSADPSVPHTWELLVGWPRRNFDQPSERLPGLENLECHNLGDMANTAPPFWDFMLTELDNDEQTDDCLPTSNMGPGMNLDLPDPQWSGLRTGPSNYFWRFAEHQGELFMSTSDVFAALAGEPLRFPLLKSPDGVTWSAIADTGLSEPVTFAGRSLLSVPHLGLALGTVDVFGSRVYIGTTLPPGHLVPPAPKGSGDQLIFDWGKIGMVDAQLDASASSDPFGGGGITAYEWFAGSLDQLGTTCPGLDANDAFSNALEPEVTDLASRIGDQTVVDHRYTLRVTDVDGLVNCKQITITASYNLPPTVQVMSGVPYGPPDADGVGTLPLVKMIDFDGDGTESYDVTGWCRDDLAKLERCELVVMSAPGNALSDVSDTSTQPALCTDLEECEVSASVSTPDTVDNAAARGAPQPEMYLIAVDDAGYEVRFQWRSLTQRISDTQDNDVPICRNADVYIGAHHDTEIRVDPSAGDRPVCLDPDGDPMIYSDGGVDPSIGAVAFDGFIEYRPEDFTVPGIDTLEFMAEDPSAPTSTPTTLRVNIVEDTTGPEVTVGFPTEGARYLRPGLRRGCGTPDQADICGSASDSRSEVVAVELSIRRISDGNWWNGTGFVAGDPVWLAAAGTESWRLGGFLPLVSGDYRVQARARDTFDNVGTSEPVDFTFSVSLLHLVLSRLFGF